MKHYSEADLLETYYMQPEESAPVMLHLAACAECSARFNRLELKMRAAAAGCPVEKPETFWSRQRLSIMRRVAERPGRSISILPTLRVAAAALLAFVLGGAVMYRHMAPRTTAPAPKAPVVATETVQTQQQPNVELQGRIDPWESEQLRDFHAVVEWESWVPETHQLSGDDAL